MTNKSLEERQREEIESLEKMSTLIIEHCYLTREQWDDMTIGEKAFFRGKLFRDMI